MMNLFASLFVLGLSAIDPVGIGIMPILLLQKHPYRRALIFLGGSFVSLMVMGLLLARGLGQPILTFQAGHSWLVPATERLAAVVLLLIAAGVYWQLRRGKAAIEPSGRTRQWLNLGSWKLFMLGAILVAVQSIIDVVFAVGMIRIGQFKLTNLELTAAVATYALSALLLQLAVVTAFWLTPPLARAKTLAVVHTLLYKFSYQALIFVTATLGLILLMLSFQ